MPYPYNGYQTTQYPYQNGFNQQYGMYQNPQLQQPIHGFIHVNGIEGARAYASRMPANSEMPLFDSNNDGTMFVVTTDGAGYPTIKVADCMERTEQAKPAQDYVTRDEAQRMYNDLASQLEQMKGAIGVPVSTATAASEQPVQQNAGNLSNAERQSPRHGSSAS